MTDQQNSPLGAANAAPSSGAPGQRPAANLSVLAAVDAELRALVAQREQLGPEVMAIGLTCWCGAMERELTRAEFDPLEVEALLEGRLRGLALELGISPRAPSRAWRI